MSEKNKLNGIESGANKYTRPSNHPASMITESTVRRFVSDTEKTKWESVRFEEGGDADTYYPVAISGLNMNEATMSLLEIYRAYSWPAPNTSDVAKPISTATQTALNNKRDTDHIFYMG